MEDLRVDFSKMPCCYWSDITKVSFLQRRLLVYSIQYYELNDTCVSDFKYDSISKQLVEMTGGLNNAEKKKTKYWYVFESYDGNTGFDLPNMLTPMDREHLTRIAIYVLGLYRRSR